MSPSALNSLTTASDEFWGHVVGLNPGLPADEFRALAEGVVALRWLAEAFTRRRTHLLGESEDPRSVFHAPTHERRDALLGAREVYHSARVAFVPRVAQWDRLLGTLAHRNIGVALDMAVVALEEANPQLDQLFPRDYARASLGHAVLETLIDEVEDFAESLYPGERLDGLALLTGELAAKIAHALNPLDRGLGGSRSTTFQHLMLRLDDQLRGLDRILKSEDEARSKTSKS